MRRALELLGGYTAEQWGMVTTRQARTLGIDDVTLHRLKEAGFLEVVRRGVHAATFVGASEVRDEQAAWLSLRPDIPGWERPELDPDGGVISHRSALRVYGLGDLVNDRIEMTVPRRRTMRDPTVWLHRADLRDDEVTVVDGLPVTTAKRTIGDLLRQHIDASHIATVIRQAVESGRVRLDELAEHIGPYARRYGVRPLDGTALLNHLLAQIGLSVTELAVRPSPVTWTDEIPWEELKDTTITWGQLAEISPELVRQLGIARKSVSAAIPADEPESGP